MITDQQIENVRAQVVADTIRLVNVRSDNKSGARAVQEIVMEMARRDGFFVTDYGCGVISVALKEGQPDLGIWVHADVVPAGDGWSHDPYDAYEYDGCIIGRGATDNKGQLAAMYHLLRLYQQSELSFNPALYIGDCEETGMSDVIAFLKTCTPPALSLVPDDGFAVGYGGKGGLTLTLRAATPLTSLQLTAGAADSPGSAVAVLADGTEFAAHTPPIHASHPDPNGNMITRISETLLAQETVSEHDRVVLELFRRISLDVYGEWLGIATQDRALGKLTVYSKSVETVDGYPSITINVRYPVGITCEQIVERIGKTAASFGCEIGSLKRGVDPYMHDPNGQTVQLLCKAANAVTGDHAEPHTLGGGTYAHRLPNAYPYGTDANVPPADFPKGRGGAHGIDEAASVDRLLRAMRVYARAFTDLNKHPEMFTISKEI